MTKTFHIDVPGQEGWIEIIDPGDLSQRKFDEWTAQARNDSGEEFLRATITAWHLVDPDSGEAMNDPQADDLKGLKISTVKAITTKVREALNDASFRST